jgi:hypothetical protein
MSVSTTTDRSLLAARASVPQHVVYRTFPAETVLLNLERGTYHGLNPSGGRMLEVLERSDTIAAAAQELAGVYAAAPEVVERDLCELCKDLRARGLVEIEDGPQSS